jgi:hypothetical protein
MDYLLFIEFQLDRVRIIKVLKFINFQIIKISRIEVPKGSNRTDAPVTALCIAFGVILYLQTQRAESLVISVALN